MDKTIESPTGENDDAELGLSRKLRRLSVAALFLSDEGGVGKSSAAIVITSLLRSWLTQGRIVERTDLWLCDPDHRSTLETFGARDVTELLLADSLQTPDGCGYFNIRTEAKNMVDKLASNSDIKLFDMPASAVDELEKMFGNTDTFLNAFAVTGTKLILVQPFVNDVKSLATAQKLKRLFCGRSGNVDVEFVFLFNHSMMADSLRTMAAFHNSWDIGQLKHTHVVHEAHIRTLVDSRFRRVIDFDSKRASNNLYDVFNTDLAIADVITMEQYLKEYAAMTKRIFGIEFTQKAA